MPSPEPDPTPAPSAAERLLGFLRRRSTAEALVAMLLLISAGALYLGLTTELVTVSQQFVYKIPLIGTEVTLYEEETTVTVVSSVETLMESGHAGLAWIVLLFSIVLPIVKLILASCIYYGRFLPPTLSHRLLDALAFLGKWAILDVLAIALFIVLTQLGDFVTVTEHPGLYWFIAAVVMSKISILTIQRIFQRRADALDPAPGVT